MIDTEIHTFSGDAIQLDPGRAAPGWTDLHIEGCRFWLAPLAVAEGGFAAGVVPGENALDTKTPSEVVEPARVTIVDTIAWGFRDGLIGRLSAFNLKENVVATLDRVTVYDSQVAFRLRGATGTVPRGAQVTIDNAVVWGIDDEAVRYENDIAPVVLRHLTVGRDVAAVFRRAEAPEGTIRGANVLVLGGALPDELAGGTSLAVDAAAFVDAAGDDYRLVAGAAAVDAGEALAEVTHDRDGVARPQGAGWDVGAYERCEGDCAAPDAGPPGRDGGGGDVDGGARRDAGGATMADAAASDGGAGGVEDGGCGCAAPGRGAGGMEGMALAALALFAVARRRG